MVIVGAIVGAIFVGRVVPRRGAPAREVAEWADAAWFYAIVIVAGSLAFVLMFIEPGWLR
jgi:hypothetical protein